MLSSEVEMCISGNGCSYKHSAVICSFSFFLHSVALAFSCLEEGWCDNCHHLVLILCLFVERRLALQVCFLHAYSEML